MRRRAYSLLDNASLRRPHSGGTAAAAVAAAIGVDNVNSGGGQQLRHLHRPRHGSRRCSRLSYLALPRAQLPAHGNGEACGTSVSRSSSGSLRQVSSSRSKNKRAAGGGAAPAAAASSTETNETVITLDGVSKQLPGGRQLFSEASLSFVRGAKVGVLGVNGSGKSTVLKIIAGVGGAFVTRGESRGLGLAFHHWFPRAGCVSLSLS